MTDTRMQAWMHFCSDVGGASCLFRVCVAIYLRRLNLQDEVLLFNFHGGIDGNVVRAKNRRHGKLLCHADAHSASLAARAPGRVCGGL